MMSEIDELAGYDDTLEAMEEELSSWTKGRETQTLDILIDMLDSMQKDQVLKKEAEDFAQQVMEEEQAIEGGSAVEQAEEQEVKDHVKEQWVARIIARRTALGMVNEPISTHQQRRGPAERRRDPSDRLVAATGSTKAPEEESVLTMWSKKKTEAKTNKQTKQKVKEELGDEFAHWLDDDGDGDGMRQPQPQQERKPQQQQQQQTPDQTDKEDTSSTTDHSHHVIATSMMKCL